MIRLCLRSLKKSDRRLRAMRNGPFALVLLSTLAGVLLMIPNNRLWHFKPEEFREFWPLMSHELLFKLDAFRGYLPRGWTVHISPHPDALGRYLGPDNESQHNIDRWGEVRASDVFIRNAELEYISTFEERQIAEAAARRAGFTGIGIYVDTVPGNMMHLDVRQDRGVSDPATWSRVAGVYGGLDAVV